MSISILTITRNNLQGLKRTVASVLGQRIQPDEFIIVDGASVDGTKEFLENLGDKAHWISELDSGISEAFNKSLIQASSEWVLFLNSGDILASSEILNECQSALATLPESTIVYAGSVDYIDANSKILMKIKSDSSALRSRCSIAHQAAFVRRAAHVKCLFDTRLNTGMDYDLWLRLSTLGEIRTTDLLVAQCEWGGVSTNAGTAIHAILLEEAIRWLNFSKTSHIRLTDVARLFFRCVYVSSKLLIRKRKQ